MSANETCCPYCFEKGKINPTINRVETGAFHSYSKEYVCFNCKNILDRDLVEKKNIPTFSIGMIGFAEQGKTRYLQSLLSFLGKQQRSNDEWEQFQVMHCNEEARNGIHEVNERENEWSKAPFTLSMFQIIDMPYIGNRFIKVYDPHDGDIFTQSLKIREQAYYLAHCDLILFIIDVAKIQREEKANENLRKLLDILQVEQVLPKDPKFTIVLINEDTDENIGDLWSDQESLQDPVLYSKLEEDSQVVKNWFMEQNNEYRGFANVLENQFSSNPISYTFLKNYKDAGILTPLLWALK